MKKMPSLFERDYENRAEDGGHKVVDRVLPAARWVADGEGVATRKWDGLAALVKDGVYFKRYDAKAGRAAPEGFEPAQPAPDEKTGHWPGWLGAKMPEDRWLLEGMAWGSRNLFGGGPVPDGTYEVCGPRIGTRHGPNPEGLSEHILLPHGRDELAGCPRDYEGLRSYLAGLSIEGVVWRHPDGRMAKIKKSDFPALPKPAAKPEQPDKSGAGAGNPEPSREGGSAGRGLPWASLSPMLVKQIPGSVETRAASLAATLLGMPARGCTIEALSGLAAELRAGALPVGSVEFVREAMRAAGVEEPANMSYPEELRGILGRSMELSTAEAARAPGPPRFVKPGATKAFTGFVFDPSAPAEALGEHEREQRCALLAMAAGAPVWMGPVVEFVAEWRAYMLGGKVVGVERYDPDGPDAVEEPGREWIEAAALPWLAASGAPAACAIDVGRLADGSLALVEANDAWALGLYGSSVAPKDYLAMLSARWRQLGEGHAPSLGGGVARRPKP